jgi:epimerase transport system membrane fusion protein
MAGRVTASVHAGMRAELQLPAFKQRGLPALKGDVIHVSAHRLTDPKTGNPYFVAAIRPDRAQLAGLPEIRLHPGMPATVQIPTEARTAFDYLVGPLTISFSRAFRQK